MLIDIAIILGVNVGVEWLLEKINQTTYEPFEKIQAKTRYIKKKKMWNYLVLLLVIMIGVMTAGAIGVNQIVMDVGVGATVALINTIFENTIFDQMRNTLR